MDFVDLLFKKYDFSMLEHPDKRVPSVLYAGDMPVRAIQLLHRKTKNRKHLESVIVLGDKVIARSDLFFRKVPSDIDEDVTLVWSISELEDQDDPVTYMVSSFKGVSPDNLYRKIKLGNNHYILQDSGNSKVPPLVSLPKPPSNAALISIEPLQWLQIGKCKILVTGGKYWLKEPMTECDSPWLQVIRRGRNYRIRISMLRSISNFLQGTFEFEHATMPTGASMKSIYNPSSFCNSKSIVYSYGNTCIQIEDDTLVSYRREYGTLVIDRAPIRHVTTFVQTEGGYMPKYLLREVIG